MENGNDSTYNVDPDEIARFESVSNQWWDPHGPFKPLHDINPLRLNYIDLRATLYQKKVLDVGCGGGILSESMALRGAEVTGIDVSDKLLNTAIQHSKISEVAINYQNITVEQMASEQSNCFDIVTCLEMLEHVEHPDSIVTACAHLVKPNGHVFFSTLNKTAKSWLFAIVGAEYILKLLPRGTHQWTKFIAPKTLANFCTRSSLNVQHMTGMLYNPITKTYRLKDHDVAVNYLIHTQKQEKKASYAEYKNQSSTL